MANKGNSARDSVVWNRLWRLVSACASELVEYFFQVRTVEGLSATTSTKDVPLTRTAELLGLADGGGKGLWRYFWGLRRNKSGPPLEKGGSQVKNMEGLLIMKTKLAACPLESLKPVRGPVKIREPAAPSQERRAPVHTCRTQSGLAAIYDFGDLQDPYVSGEEWQHWNAATSTEYQLRPGMRGRHIFGPRSNLAGRCFEWKVLRE
jgi:hypothetical protein